MSLWEGWEEGKRSKEMELRISRRRRGKRDMWWVGVEWTWLCWWGKGKGFFRRRGGFANRGGINIGRVK